MQNDFLADLAATIPDLDAAPGTRVPTPSSSPSSPSSPSSTLTPRCEADPAPDDFRGRLLDPHDAERYCLAGKATITLHSAKTGTSFTYRINAADDGAAHFVGLLVGPDNYSDYKYLGRIARGIFWQGRKVPRAGDIGKDAPSSLAFAFAWRAIVSGSIPSALEIWHEGSCGRCSRKLTRRESIKQGFGPECYEKMGLAGLAEDFGQ